MSVLLPSNDLIGTDKTIDVLGGLTPMGRANDPQKTDFAGVLSVEQSKLNRTETIVKKGDTLTGIVKTRYQALGLPINERQAYREALRLAANNAIADPNRIDVGQKITHDPGRMAASTNSLQALMQRPGLTQPPTDGPAVSGTLLDKTLQRAVDKGFLDASEVSAAKEKISSMATQFGFDTDHFAMLTLMESNGMDPKSDNGRCFGVIQFCEGSSSGAASVGMAGKAKTIKNMGLLSQLDLVRQYFNDLGLSATNGHMGLDDLYLSVLHPAVKTEKRRDVQLAIPGRQAKDLYVGNQNQLGITRNSITHALMAKAKQIFPEWNPVHQSTKLSKMMDSYP